MKQWFVFCLFTSGIFWASLAWAQTKNGCAAFTREPPEIEVMDVKRDLQFDHTQGKKFITHLAKSSDFIGGNFKKGVHEGHSPYFLVGENLGLTVGLYNYEYSVLFDFKVAPGFFQQSLCPRIRKVFVKFYYSPKIYVAKEYRSNKCAFNIILKHEFNHHYVNLTNKEKYLSWLRQDLPAVTHDMMRRYSPIASDQRDVMKEKMEADVRDAIEVYISKMYADTSVENAKLDTASEYLRLNRAISRCYQSKKN